MRRPTRKPEKPQPAPVDRFAGMRTHAHDDDDDRQSGQDRAPLTSQLFSPAVTLFLKPRKKR